MGRKVETPGPWKIRDEWDQDWAHGERTAIVVMECGPAVTEGDPEALAWRVRCAGDRPKGLAPRVFLGEHGGLLAEDYAARMLRRIRREFAEAA